MQKIAFVDDNLLLCDCYVKRAYDELKEKIKGGGYCVTESLTDGGEVFGFNITRNQNVSQIYGMDCYVVKFVFSNISQLHDSRQEQILCQLLMKLEQYINIHKGYYNLRIPTHIVDLIKALNVTFVNPIFCGGTVEELIHGKYVDDCNANKLTIEFADREYIEKYEADLLEMTLKSFETYQGQYHISGVTQDKAGLIYENWIKGSMSEQNNERCAVAKIKELPVGFVTIKETDNAVEGVLSAVDSKNRKLGAYKAMIAYLINYAHQKNKSFVTSTQFDNFIVQGVWNSLGLRPFYSIYNIHIDNR
ncbi:MAG: hypothetical protein OSJ72_09375 [Lachnospiraceae bacterium]|nr:hypothetical protein [Lachnospiraceae bacterium]